ncbi:MAG: H4MPT-linked C1 transfer pathway protein [Methylotenera sp.]|nr:H4MPT-linked C1 transfer pathway protein [Methylotenera sp.]
MNTTINPTLQDQTPPPIMAWDVGGAHLKAVRTDAVGQVLAVTQVYCPLWRGLSVLSAAIDQVLAEFTIPSQGHRHCVTMTGELADIFPNRATGVMQIAQLLQDKLGEQLQFYAGYQHWVSLSEAQANTHNIASMNWLASVEYLATQAPNALFVDVGSTTTDLVFISHGQPNVKGFSDAQRMQTNELIYTGVVRTPLMALGQKVNFFNAAINLAAEHFATTADVYRLTGDLSQDQYSAETADGADKSLAACARRIARMIGRDADEWPMADWQALAQAFKALQLQQIKQAIAGHLMAFDGKTNVSLIGAGVGDFLLPGLAEELKLAYLSVTDFMPADSQLSGSAKRMAAVCFPVYAVAKLGRAHA